MKRELIKMLIPLIGIYWVFENIIDLWKEKEIGVIGISLLFYYQLLCWIVWKILLEHWTLQGHLPIHL